MKKPDQKSLEERLSLLEHRMAIIEAGKNTAKIDPKTDIIGIVGISYLLRHIHDKIMASPQSGDFDSHLEGVFNVKITPQNRLEYADKAWKLSLALLDDAVEECKKRKS